MGILLDVAALIEHPDYIRLVNVAAFLAANDVYNDTAPDNDAAQAHHEMRKGVANRIIGEVQGEFDRSYLSRIAVTIAEDDTLRNSLVTNGTVDATKVKAINDTVLIGKARDALDRAARQG